MKQFSNFSDEATEGWSSVGMEEERVERDDFAVSNWRTYTEELGGLKCVVGEWYYYIFYSFRYFESAECFEDRSDMVALQEFSDSMEETTLNSLKTGYLGDVFIPKKSIATV